MYILTVSANGVGMLLNTKNGNAFRCRASKVKNSDGSEVVTIVPDAVEKAAPVKPVQQSLPVTPAAPAGAGKGHGDYRGRTRVTDVIRAQLLLFKNKNKLTWAEASELIGVSESTIRQVAYVTNYQMRDGDYDRMMKAITTLNGDN